MTSLWIMGAIFSFLSRLSTDSLCFLFPEKEMVESQSLMGEKKKGMRKSATYPHDSALYREGDEVSGRE
ncbi:MAG: hypothetical protein KGI97_00350 [Alphaproteobacteria bacterium]|nr:hypothetical protein [Alphaproteobacteria bacterium]